MRQSFAHAGADQAAKQRREQAIKHDAMRGFRAVALSLQFMLEAHFAQGQFAFHAEAFVRRDVAEHDL